MKYLTLVFACVCMISTGSVPESSVDLMKGEQVRQEILRWLTSIQTLECSYRYRSNTPAGFWQDEEVVYRWKKNMLYYQATTLANGGADKLAPIGSVITESLVDGKGALLGYQDQRLTGEINREDIHFPNSTRQVRKLLFLQSFEKVLRTSPQWLELHTILSLPGLALYRERGEDRILMYWTTNEQETSAGVNVYMDDQSRVVKVEYVNRPPFCTFADVQRLATKDPFEVCMKLSTASMLDHVQVDGIWFPTHIKEEIYDVTATSDRKSQPLRERAAAGEVTWCEFFVKWMEGLEYEPIPTLDEVHIDPLTLHINKDLPKSDFEIDIPPKTDMVDIESGEVITTAQETWLERHADFVIILATLVFLGGITVFGWRYWRGRA